MHRGLLFAVVLLVGCVSHPPRSHEPPASLQPSRESATSASSEATYAPHDESADPAELNLEQVTADALPRVNLEHACVGPSPQRQLERLKECFEASVEILDRVPESGGLDVFIARALLAARVSAHRALAACLWLADAAPEGAVSPTIEIGRDCFLGSSDPGPVLYRFSCSEESKVEGEIAAAPWSAAGGSHR